MKSQMLFSNDLEEEEYSNNLYSKLIALKENNYIKLPTYIVELRRIYPYVEELKSNIFKFRNEVILNARKLFTTMKQDFVNFKQVIYY